MDVEHIAGLKKRHNFVYETYEDLYAFDKQDLQSELDKGNSPILVVNDVRVIYELKKIFPNKVLALFVFRDIRQEEDTHIQASQARGTASQAAKRFEKAVALYRVFIENNHLFDRVILNVLDNKMTKLNPDTLQKAKELVGDTGMVGSRIACMPDQDIAKIQSCNIVKYVLGGESGRPKGKGAKLFIISGNAMSGKDELLRAVLQMGGNLSDVVVKYTTRNQQRDDNGEIICRYVPKQGILDALQEECESEKNALCVQYLDKDNWGKWYPARVHALTEEYWTNEKIDKIETSKTYISLQEYIDAGMEIWCTQNLEGVPSAMDRFWKIHQQVESLLSQKYNKLSKEEVNKALTQELFEKNAAYSLDIESLMEQCKKQIDAQNKEMPSGENRSYLLTQEKGEKYIVYQNNEGDIWYGFRADDLGARLQEGKHLVLTASLPRIFSLCKVILGEDRVVVSYTYSQINQDDFLKENSDGVSRGKIQEFDDIHRYASHIKDFDYAFIYAVTSNHNKGAVQKGELFDQLSRLFMYYNEGI